MANKSIRRNYIYNTCYEIIRVITPLITASYLARAIGADGVGTISFAESKVSYFMLVAAFGIETYGRREISYVVDNEYNRSKVFWEALILEITTTVIVFAAYLPFAMAQDNTLLYLILGFDILAVAVNVTWFFQGMEEFGKVVLRDMIFKLVYIVYIFLFVKDKGDLLIYAFGLAFFLFLSNASLILYLPKYVKKISIKELRPFSHVRTVFSLFVPTIAIQIYTVLDKTMIGIITKSAFENGYYEQAIKISKMVLAIVTSLGFVMVPRIGYHFGKGEKEQVSQLMYRAYRYVFFLGIPLCFGLIGISSNLVPWFFGDGFDKVIPLLRILSFLIIIIGMSTVTGMQYLIPTKRQNMLTLTVVIGACVNFLMNCVLIKNFQSIGAAVSSVAAESVITAVQLYIVRKELSVKTIFLSGKNYLFAGTVMLALLSCLARVLPPSVICTFLMILLGAAVYFAVLFLIKDSFCVENVNSTVNKIRNIAKKQLNKE